MQNYFKPAAWQDAMPAALESSSAFGVYFSILKECVDDWERGQVGRLIIVFPAKLNERVSQLREQLI